VARIKDSSVRDTIAAADMVEIVSARTALRKAGGRYVGRCPFHDERTPSFSVNAADKLYYCFGCGKGGDVVSFVRDTENLDFVGAIEFLAERFRLQLEYEESSPAADDARRRRERLHAVLDQAATFFERHLWDSPAGEPVRAYLTSRNLGEAIAKEFRLGLSPGRGLAAKAKEKGFTDAELRAAGLVNARGNDYFPQRLMFPLADARGRIIGFQARKLRDDDPLRGKYVNSPEGELFHKSSILYGLHLARPAIAKEDRAVIVEGNTDVIALRQAGLEPVVASMGTALTDGHLRELGRLTKRLFLCFDSDAAGEEATLRGMELAVGQGFDVKVVSLPKGQDPADAPVGFAERLQRASSYLVHRVRLEIARSADKQEAYVRAREVLEKAEESPERQEALRILGDELGLPDDVMRGIAPARGSTRRPAREVPQRLLDAGARLERDALAACLAHPELRDGLSQLGADLFDDEVHRRFRAVLVEGAAEDAELVALHAELDARIERERITEASGTERLLQLRERKLRRELAAPGLDMAHAKELQEHLAKVRQKLAELT
jgi:DNA primase